MSDFIKGVQVGSEVKKYDYDALGNKPTLVEVDSTLKVSGKAADSKVVGQRFKEVEQSITNTNTTVGNNATAIQNNATAIQNTQTALDTTNENLVKTNDRIGEVKDDLEQANDTLATNVANTLANALKGTASGAVARVDDVSPVEHEVAVKVRPKNLFDYTKIVATNTYQKFPIFVDVGKTYTLSSNIPKGSGAEVYFNGDYTDVNGVWDGQPRTFVAETSEMYVAFQDRGNVQYVLDGTYYIQLEKGDTATEYTPYVDPSSVTVTRCGKNLLDIDKMCTSCITKVAEGKYRFTKGATTGDRFSGVAPLYVPKGTQLYLSCNITDYTVTNTILYMIFTYADGTQSFPGVGFSEGGREITLPNDLCSIQFYMTGDEEAGAYITFDSLQIEKSDVATAYETYNGETYTTSADGTVTVNSVSPTMTISTAVVNVNVNVEYNRDTNAVIKKLTDAIIALGGTV